MTIDVARYLCAHSRWQWRSGMLARGGGWGLTGPWASWRSDQPERLGSGGPPYVDNAYPDLDDPATAGVLLGMLGEALEVVSVGREDGIWFAGDGHYTHRKVHECGPTLGVAVARALLAVWGAE